MADHSIPLGDLKYQGPQRRQLQTKRIVEAMGRRLFSRDLAAVPQIRPTVGGAVAVEQFSIDAPNRDPETVILPRDRGEIKDADQRPRRASTQKGEDRLRVVIAVDPLEAIGLRIPRPERVATQIKLTEVLV